MSWFWWWLRGVVAPEDYRTICRRCGRTGQTHVGLSSLWTCLRFTPMRVVSHNEGNE